MKNKRGLGCDKPMGATLFERMFPQSPGISATGPVAGMGKSPYFSYPGSQLTENPMGHFSDCNCDACSWMTDAQYPKTILDRGTPTDYPGRVFRRINRNFIDGATMWDDMWGGPKNTVQCKVPNVQGPGGADVTTYTDGEPLQNYWNGNKPTAQTVSVASPVARATLCSVNNETPVQTTGNTVSPVSTPPVIASSSNPGQNFNSNQDVSGSSVSVDTISNTMPSDLSGKSYTIAPGDTLALIAITTGIDVPTLVAQNPVLDGYGQMDDLSGLAGNLLAIPSAPAPIAQSYNEGVTAASVNPTSAISQAVNPVPVAVSTSDLTVAPLVVPNVQTYNDAVSYASVNPISQVNPYPITGISPPATLDSTSVSPTVVGQEALSEPIVVPVSTANSAAQNALSMMNVPNTTTGLVIPSVTPLAAIAIAAGLLAIACSISWSSSSLK